MQNEQKIEKSKIHKWKNNNLMEIISVNWYCLNELSKEHFEFLNLELNKNNEEHLQYYKEQT